MYVIMCIHALACISKLDICFAISEASYSMPEGGLRNKFHGFGGVSSIDFGCIFMHFRLLSQERIHLGKGVEPGNSPKYTHVQQC